MQVLCIVYIFSLDISCQVEVVVIYEFECFGVIMNFYYRKQGFECFVFYDVYIVIDVDEKVWSYISFCVGSI